MRFLFCEFFIILSIFVSTASANPFDESEKILNATHRSQKQFTMNVRKKIDDQVVARFHKIVDAVKSDSDWKNLSVSVTIYLKNLDSLKAEIYETEYFSSDQKKAYLIVIENYEQKAVKLESFINSEISRRPKSFLASRGGVKAVYYLETKGIGVVCNNGSQFVPDRNSSNETCASSASGEFKCFRLESQTADHICQ
jgi:hypothetical protein